MWLPITELLLADANAEAGGIAGLIKRSEVLRPPCQVKISLMNTYAKIAHFLGKLFLHIRPYYSNS
jgi:hypothetical protein